MIHVTNLSIFESCGNITSDPFVTGWNCVKGESRAIAACVCMWGTHMHAHSCACTHTHVRAHTQTHTCTFKTWLPQRHLTSRPVESFFFSDMLSGHVTHERTRQPWLTCHLFPAWHGAQHRVTPANTLAWAAHCWHSIVSKGNISELVIHDPLSRSLTSSIWRKSLSIIVNFGPLLLHIGRLYIWVWHRKFEEWKFLQLYSFSELDGRPPTLILQPLVAVFCQTFWNLWHLEAVLFSPLKLALFPRQEQLL